MENLAQRVADLAQKIETFEALSDDAKQEHMETFLVQLRIDIHSLCEAVLTLPSEEDRHDLLDKIIRALKSGGFILSTIEKMVDIFS